MDNKIYGVLDVGSNSVRALVYSDGKIIYTGLITSRLGEGIADSGKLSAEAMMRNRNAILTLRDKCLSFGADEPFVFATEAVRSADNGEEFVALLKADGVDVEVISGEEEGELSLLGALGGKDGGVIDIGGASTEIVIAKGGKIVYSHSLPLGAVRLTDSCGEDENLLKTAIGAKIGEYGAVPKEAEYSFVGGTSTALAMISYGINKYDPEKIDGLTLSLSDILRCLDIIKKNPLRERAEKLKISEKRAEVVFAGAYMIKSVMERFAIKKVTVKTADNMMGYLKKRVFGEKYER